MPAWRVVGAAGACAGRVPGLHLHPVSNETQVKHRRTEAPIPSPYQKATPMKTPMSRFQIHDDLTAPEGSVPVLRGALATGGQLPNFLGVLAGSPAALRAYARFRSELRHGKLPLATLERIALAVAEYYKSEPGIAMHSRAARAAGLAIDEVALARQFRSNDR